MPELSLELQEKLERLRIHFDSCRSFLLTRSGVLPIIASLSAAILVVATFNPELLPITKDIKIILSILLLLIPISLLVYLYEAYGAVNSTLKAISKIVGKDIMPQLKTKRQKIANFFIGYFPVIGTIILFFAIIYLVIAIWHKGFVIFS